jgi:hypothetical protein
MRKYLLILLGLVLYGFGAIALAAGGIPHTRRHSFNVGTLKITGSNEETLPVHPLVSGAALLAGLGLVFYGAKSK